mgnify:CR=1 FL=1
MDRDIGFFPQLLLLTLFDKYYDNADIFYYPAYVDFEYCSLASHMADET